MFRKIIIGTRGSQLALWQAKYTQELLAQEGVESELKIIVTSGDKNQNWENSFDKLEGKNFFTKEIEDALLKKEIDLAVHSFKDVEAVFWEEKEQALIIAGLSPRHPANDILILHKDAIDKKQILFIKKNARIGTSSARRYAQLHSLREDIDILPLRGNVPTRIEKLKNRQYDGIILARAGIERLNIPLNEFDVLPLPLHHFVPAAGQGIIAFQIRKEDNKLYSLIQKFSDKTSEECSKVERSLLKWMGGGCSKPIGIYCEKSNSNYQLFISFNNDKTKTSIPCIIQDKEITNLTHTAKECITKIKNYLQYPTNKKILITKTLNESNLLKKMAQRLQWTIIDKPFIQTRPLIISEIPNTDWIFFNSKNAVKYFIENSLTNKEILKNKKVGCIGLSTANFLEQYNITPDFIGQSTDIEKVALEFLKVCQQQSVLFPSSKISNKSIGKIIEKNCNVIYLPIYETIELQEKLRNSLDIIVFTSPSNVRSFLKNNTISEKTKILAMGESTKNELLQHSIPPSLITMPIAFDDIAIAGAIMQII